MLNFELIDEKNFEVSVTLPDDKEKELNENNFRFLGKIIKDMDEYKFFTTPTEYFHALWWVEDGDLENLKQKLLELNGG